VEIASRGTGIAEEAADLGELARTRMQGVFELAVPLVVDVGVGANWREAH